MLVVFKGNLNSPQKLYNKITNLESKAGKMETRKKPSVADVKSLQIWDPESEEKSDFNPYCSD